MTDFSLFHPKLHPLINNILTHNEPTQWHLQKQKNR